MNSGIEKKKWRNDGVPEKQPPPLARDSSRIGLLPGSLSYSWKVQSKIQLYFGYLWFVSRPFNNHSWLFLWMFEQVSKNSVGFFFLHLTHWLLKQLVCLVAWLLEIQHFKKTNRQSRMWSEESSETTNKLILGFVDFAWENAVQKYDLTKIPDSMNSSDFQSTITSKIQPNGLLKVSLNWVLCYIKHPVLPESSL